MAKLSGGDLIAIEAKYYYTVRRKYLEGENIGEFGKFIVIHQIFNL